MKFTAGCWRPRLAALMIATSWLAACATGNSEPVAACPPIVEYSGEFQAPAADELAMLPEESAVVEMLADYAVMREQARACRREGGTARSSPGTLATTSASSDGWRPRPSDRPSELPRGFWRGGPSPA